MEKKREIEKQLNLIENQIKDVILDDLKPKIEAEFEVRVLTNKKDIMIKQAISFGFIPTWENGVWKLAEGVQSYMLVPA